MMTLATTDPGADGRAADAAQERLRAYDAMLFSRPPADVRGHPQMRYLRRFLPADRTARILDAGCGNGAYARALARLGYTNVVGVDLHPVVDTGDLFEYRCASLETTGLPDASADAAYALSVIYHVENPRAALTELRRVLRPGGVLVLSAHTRYSLFTVARVLRRRRGRAPHLLGVRFQSASEYRRMLESVGFEVVDIDGYDLNYLAETPVGWLLGRFVPRGRIARRGPAWPTRRDPAWLRRLRSVAGYHFMIAARAVDGPTGTGNARG